MSRGWDVQMFFCFFLNSWNVFNFVLLIAGLDYERISNVTIEFGVEETEFSEFSEFSFDVTILPDSRLEIEEIFIVRLSSEEGERVNFNFGNSLDVVIADDDSKF